KTFAPSTYKIPTIKEIPKNFNVYLLKKAAQDGVIYGSKAVGEPPFMLAISVREAIRDAIAAFGDTDSIFLASPATPEAILNAIEQVQLNQ
ncbi:MAG: xanthine dehydrogenase molybdopterin binding subunit, partial [Planktothrix sp.]